MVRIANSGRLSTGSIDPMLAGMVVILGIVVTGTMMLSFLLDSMLQSRLSGADIAARSFEPVRGVSIEGGGNAVFQEGFTGGKARFVSPSVPHFREPVKWSKLSNSTEILAAVETVRTHFASDKTSLSNMADLEVFVKDTSTYATTYVHNKHTNAHYLVDGLDLQTKFVSELKGL